MPAIPNVMALVCGYEEVMITEQACARLQARPGACGPLCSATPGCFRSLGKQGCATCHGSEV